jgi:YVTN family beta-propeller protein
MHKRIAIVLSLTGLLVYSFAQEGEKPQPDRSPRPPAKIGHPPFMSPHASPIALHGNRVFVVNTPSDTVDVIDTESREIVARIDVGIDPVGIAVRPDGNEVWVANHVSDSVSVIDTDTMSPTYLQVVATVQEFDRRTKATRFDEPVGVAFASNEKAYVALSSENKIAVISVATRKVEKHIAITAQDPRAIVTRGDRLYVIPFESNNKTQLSGGYEVDGELVTFNAHEHSIANNNVLSLGHVTDIVKHPKVPDRDLYVFDTKTDKLVQVVDTLGTLLYGLTVDSNGRVFVAQVDARNDVNGRAGTKKHGLVELENRAFLNQITHVNVDGDTSEKPEFINLEPLPPNHPAPGEALATPFAIQISDDDSTLVVSAAGSDKIFTVDAKSGDALGRVEVDAVPRGIALESAEGGKPSQAWVLNAVANTVSLVDVSDSANLVVKETIALHDPTPPAFKRGRIAFNKAAASTTESFSCASCHPDGHTDQLLWVLKTPVVTGGNQIMPRSTMPLRGLRDTAPFHWDGIPGDPYGGNNSANIYSNVEPNSSLDVPESTTRFLIDAGLASTMAMVGDTKKNDEGKAGLLSAAERDDMARFLLNITYPPAQRRAYTNELSKRAKAGFDLFHIKGDAGGTPGSNLCGNCHRMPFLVSTNTPGTGMDAPTWRGAYDRFLILPQGRLNIIDFDFYRRVAEEGIPERKVWQFSWGGRQAFDPVWDMVLEGSTGYSGSFARQVTMNEETADAYLTHDLLDALESFDGDGAVVLQANGVFIEDGKGTPVNFQFDADLRGGSYVEVDSDRAPYSRAKLASLASQGKFIGTFTGRHGAKADYDHPQPGLWTLGSIHAQQGQQVFPIVYGDKKTMTMNARHLRDGANIIENGRRVSGSISKGEGEQVEVTLETLPTVGMHFLQVQNPDGLFSNDFIFHVAENEEKAKALRYTNNPDLLRDALAEAIESGNLDETKRFLDAGAPLNARRRSNGMTPLSTAVFHGRMEIVKHLIEDRKARVSHDNRDGNTPLHLAAFLCRTELVKYLLEKGASHTKKSGRGETAVDTVSSPWNDGLARFYTSISDDANLSLVLEEIERLRPQIVRMLRDDAGEPEDAVKVLTRGATGWRYLSSGAGLSAEWIQADFDDSKWKTGQAPLGYGEEDIETEISFGEDGRNKRPAAFFRRSFEIVDLNTVEVFAAAVRADDGAVIYLNGKEIKRLRMPKGQIGHETFSEGDTQSESGLEGKYVPLKIDAEALREGENMLAVSVHQRHGASSDLVLDIEILGVSQKDYGRLERSRTQ